MHLLEIANFAESNECTRGECVTSITQLSKDTGWAYGVVRGILNRLEEENLISISTRKQKRGIVVKVCEYDQLQSIGSYRKEEQEHKVKHYPEQLKNSDNWKTNAHAFYEENINQNMSVTLAEKITDRIQDFEDGEEVVIYAMETAVLKNKLNWQYIDGILTNWKNANLKTLSAIKANQEQRMKQRKIKNNFNSYGRKIKHETLPEHITAADKQVDPEDWKEQKRILEERIKNL